jgi:hypothetical protein
MSTPRSNFPCKHDLYELAGKAACGNRLSTLQHYCPAQFVHVADPNCFYCKQEQGFRVPMAEVIRAKKSA